jgi:uncharacterized protein DUF4870
MDCFFHHAVPSVALCTGCRKPVCATCRTESGDCPSCRLAARIDAAAQANQAIHGGVGPSRASYAPPPPPPQYEPPPQYGAPPSVQRHAALATVRPETRALVALSYPFWPLALIALLDGKAQRFVKRQAWQALGFNFGMYGLTAVLGAAAATPILGFGVWTLMLPFLIPVWVVASVVYGLRVWQGDDVDVPVVSDWIDARLPQTHSST